MNHRKQSQTGEPLPARVDENLEITRLRHDAERSTNYWSAHYETLLNHAPLGVYLIDADFRILEVNPKAHPVFRQYS